MPACPGCGISRKSLVTPCAVCGTSTQPEVVAAANERTIAEGGPTIKVAVQGRAAGEPKATAKQLDYLRQLGMTDRATLGTLGRWQASDLIDGLKKAEAARGSRAALGCFVVFLAVLAIIIAVAVNASR